MDIEILNSYRVKNGDFATIDDDRFGAFFIPLAKSGKYLKVICSPFDDKAQEWEHVSVSLPNRCPTWDEMCVVKDLFWDENKTVIQYHPEKKDYINNHSYCLHLWRNTRIEVPKPSSYLVGVK